MSDEELTKLLRRIVQETELLIDAKLAPLEAEIEALKQRLAVYERRIESLESLEDESR